MQYNHGIVSSSLRGMPSVRNARNAISFFRVAKIHNGRLKFIKKCNGMVYPINNLEQHHSTNEIAFKSSQIPKSQE